MCLTSWAAPGLVQCCELRIWKQSWLQMGSCSYQEKKWGESGKLMLGFSSQAVQRLAALTAWLCAWWGGRCTFRWFDFSSVNRTLSALGFTWGKWRGLVRSCLLAHPGLWYIKWSAKSGKWFTTWSCWATKTSVFLKWDFNMFCYVAVFLPSLKMQNYCLMWRPIGISQDCLLFKVILQEVFLIFFNMFV